LVCGDFNEDFGGCSPLSGFGMLQRSVGEPTTSRPAHKQGPTQKSGKGLVDCVFVKGSDDLSVHLERDAESGKAVAISHARCAETGEWPSDHGMEALSVLVATQQSQDEDDVMADL
jgi:hypothetical protein